MAIPLVYFHDDADICLAFSAFSDLVLAVYPATIIWNLNMARRVKLIITFVMMLGILLGR